MRISEEHGVAINTVFFNVFEADGREWLTTDFLLNQEAVEERSERKVRAPWSGYFFVNTGLGEHRSWTDMRRYGFISAGGGEFYTKRLQQLSVSQAGRAADRREALGVALSRNAKHVLPLPQIDRLNAAWRLVREANQARQATLQTPQQDRDHVRATKGLAQGCHPLRQVRKDFPRRRRPRRNRHVLAMTRE